jgi:hypothetical protein
LLAEKIRVIFPHLDERQRRLLIGAEARVLGHGGIRVVARAAGVRAATVSLVLSAHFSVHGSMINGNALSSRPPRAAPRLQDYEGIRGRIHAGQRVAAGGQTSLPWRLSRSVIDAVDLVGADFARNADSARSATAPVRRLAACRSPGSGAVGLPVCCGTLHGYVMRIFR